MDTAPGVDGPTITTKDAAAFFRVPQSTVHTWVSRYRIKAVGRLYGQPGRPKLYRFADIANAERRTRTNPKGRGRSHILKFDWQE